MGRGGASGGGGRQRGGEPAAVDPNVETRREHGHGRKRVAVALEEHPAWSDREIAAAVGVSASLVWQVRTGWKRPGAGKAGIVGESPRGGVQPGAGSAAKQRAARGPKRQRVAAAPRAGRAGEADGAGLNPARGPTTAATPEGLAALGRTAEPRPDPSAEIVERAGRDPRHRPAVGDVLRMPGQPRAVFVMATAEGLVGLVALPPGYVTAAARDRYLVQRGGNVWPGGGLRLEAFRARYEVAEVHHVESEPTGRWADDGSFALLEAVE